MASGVYAEMPSRIDGSPIVAVVTVQSMNPKTGNTPQLWILPRMVDPLDAARTGQDAGICGDCPLRWSAERSEDLPRCYVTWQRAPLAIWRAWRAGSYLPATWRRIDRIVSGRMVRLGAAGDPVAIPAGWLRRLLSRAGGWTGYTHLWRRSIASAHKPLLMASVESDADARLARRRGWRTFRIRSSAEDPVLKGEEIPCPASREMGHRTTCSACRLCDGRRGSGDRRVSVAIIRH